MPLVSCLQLLGLKSFRTGAVMLAGLLLYDVFWVFGSKSVIGDNVMLTVATSDIVSGPTRLLFPRIAGGTGEASNFPFSLLGESPLPSVAALYFPLFQLYITLQLQLPLQLQSHWLGSTLVRRARTHSQPHICKLQMATSKTHTNPPWKLLQRWYEHT